MTESPPNYRGRLAPSPTGLLHLGHARTFWIAHERARRAGGTLVFRNEDLDRARCRPEFVTAMLEDLRWLGLAWTEGPDIGGPFAPYAQSERLSLYRAAFDRLRAAGLVYACTCSRRDIAESASAPHESATSGLRLPADRDEGNPLTSPRGHDGGAVGDEPLYAGTCRPERLSPEEQARRAALPRAGTNWRLRVPDGRALQFVDSAQGEQHATGGQHFGDFLVWRKDDFPSYQLAVVVDDLAMRITEVVRGADLLLSTFRQLLLYEALGATGGAVPQFHHCALVLDENGTRLAKRHDALSLRALRESGATPEAVRARFGLR